MYSSTLGSKVGKVGRHSERHAHVDQAKLSDAQLDVATSLVLILVLIGVLIFANLAPVRAISKQKTWPQRGCYLGHQHTVVIPRGCPPQRLEILAVCQLA